MGEIRSIGEEAGRHNFDRLVNNSSQVICSKNTTFETKEYFLTLSRQKASKVSESQMIIRTAIKTLSFVAGCCVLTACGEGVSKSKARSQAVIDAYNLSPVEASAFRTCQSQMRRADFKPRSGVRMTRVPAEICACHAPMMVKHFKPGKGSEHALVLAFVSGVSTETILDPESLLDPNEPRKQFTALARNLNECAETAAQENTLATRNKIAELCENGTLSEKKCEETLAKLK